MREALWRPIYLRRSQVRITAFSKSRATAPLLGESEIHRHVRVVAQGGRRSFTTALICHHASGSHPLLCQSSDLASILQQAPHGIDSHARLAFEADVGHARGIGSRLTDLPVNRQDLDLWLVLLEYRLLKDGRQGLRDILQGMRIRGEAVKLLEYDDASDQIWKYSLAAAADDDTILHIISHPTTGVGRDRPTLFLDLVTILLKSERPRLAIEVARRLRTSHFRGQRDLRALFELVLDEASPVTLEDFCAIHHVLPFVSIYAHTVPLLWNTQKPDKALKLHTHLMDHYDFPPMFEHLEPLIRQLALDNKPLEPFLAELDKACLSFSAQAKNFYAGVKAFQSGVSMEAIDLTGLGKAGVRQRTLSDQFVARVLATHALSFEFALKSLKFFGLVEIGPLAIRELGISAKNLEEVNARLRLLEELQIDTGSSNFAVVVKNLCRGNSRVLLKAVLQCDQHHDVFEDRETQKRLLTEYYYKRDWPQVNRTLAILNRGRTGLSAQQSAQSMLLKSAIIVRDWRGVLIRLTSILGYAHTKSPSMSRESMRDILDFIIDIVLAKGKSNEISDKVYINRIRYLIGVLQDMECSGVSIDFKYWKSILFRLGELSRFSDVESLSLWLAAFYHKKHQNMSIASNTSNPPAETGILESLFESRLQAAILQWGLTAIVLHSSSPAQVSKHKNRGLELLQALEESYGIGVDHEEVRKRYQSRLESLAIPSHMVKLLVQQFDEAKLSHRQQGTVQTEDLDLGFVNPFFQPILHEA